ncbi:unnamed protein product [Mytilus coruscus]|uniref:B box-type domain-containing protein n=1 Tax=Mytilus coruscus TaxID=42192 RepID=A0A6J8CGB6_MYTCO|nr:unnamed protein product [Mytilus coruscus]
MAASSSLCGVCTLRHISKPSIVWCTECVEGLCTECQEHHSLSRASRNHDTIPITEYQKLPPDVLSISQYCDKHNEKYQIYCKKHESPCCSICIVESHNECQDIVTLSDVIMNAKTSNTFYEIEQTLAEVLENIKKIRENRQDNLKTLSKDRAIIELKIEEAHTIIKNHLDKMKIDIIKELDEVEKQESKEISQLIKVLEENENDIVESQRKIESIRQHASDLQAFLAMKQLEKDVFLKDVFLQSLVDKHTIKQYSLIYQPNATLQNFVSNVGTFDKVLIETKQHDSILTTSKRKQAQMMVQDAKSKAIEDISLKLHMTINGTGNYIFGCCMLPDNKTIFTNRYSNSLRILNKDGSLECTVKTSHSPYDVECINKDTLVVSSGYSSSTWITIIDIKSKKVNKEIPLDSIIDGIAGTDWGLIYYGGEKGIGMINHQNEPLFTIVREEELDEECYVATFANSIYQTRSSKNCVICYDRKGNIQWTFKKDNVLNYPVGISVDKHGNVFVIGYNSKNVVVISGDGKRHREVLSSKDGLASPRVLHYDRSTNQLLVANTSATAFIYDSI